MRLSLELLSHEEAVQIHEASLQVLARTGMRIDCLRLRVALRAGGAQVDDDTRRVRFPERMVEETLEANRRARRGGRRLHLLNGVTSERTGAEIIAAKIGGGCERFLPWDTRSPREAAAADLEGFVRMGEALPDVAFVGNPVVIHRGADGSPIEERLRRVETAALVAKHTRKLGSIEVWDVREIDLLVEIGTIARGGAEQFQARPCFVTAKETISPLFLDERSGEILLELARRGLPCTVIPMPLSGLSAPLSMGGTAVIGNAEILGTFTAIGAACPDALMGAGMISGVADMRSAAASFSAPEAILQDLAVAEVHERLYGLDFLVGTGYTDARHPDAQLLAEKTLKYLFTALSGRFSFPLGLIRGGSVFSLEQALVDLEICRYLRAHLGRSLGLEGMPELLRLIERVGVRGSFLEESHTLAHFRDNWLPGLFEIAGLPGPDEGRVRDIYGRAHNQAEELLSRRDGYSIDPAGAAEIDRVVASARRIL